MEPGTGTLLTEGAKLGFSVMLLLVAVIFFAKWVKALVEDAKSESLARELTGRAECLDRERSLSLRLGVIEDRQFAESAEILRRCAGALELNAKALARLTDSDTGLHLALINKRSK